MISQRRLAAVAAIAVLGLTGCETTQEKSAKLERVAKVREAREAKANARKRRLTTIAHPSTKVAIQAVTLLHSSEGLATVVTLLNRTGTALREVPVRVDVRDAHGRSLFTNETPGQAEPLISASYLPPHGRLQWIDDQIPPNAGAVSATAEAGEGQTAPSSGIPRLSIADAHQSEDAASGAGAEGQIVNHSATAQSELVVYAVVRHAGQVVAAGRAVLSDAPAGASTRFQLFFIGNPRGGSLEVEAPPSTLG